jgi:hypothetical protein
MREFIKFYNSSGDDITFLYEVINNDLREVMRGDDYHDKIDFTIRGFFDGFGYLNEQYRLITINVVVELKDDYLYELSTKKLEKLFKEKFEQYRTNVKNS